MYRNRSLELYHPLPRVDWIVSKTASTAFVASFFERPAASATELINSDLFNHSPPLKEMSIAIL